MLYNFFYFFSFLRRFWIVVSFGRPHYILTAILIFFLRTANQTAARAKKAPFLPFFGFLSFLHHFLQSWALFSSFFKPIRLVSKFLKIDKFLFIYFRIYLFKKIYGKLTNPSHFMSLCVLFVIRLDFKAVITLLCWFSSLRKYLDLFEVNFVIFFLFCE